MRLADIATTKIMFHQFALKLSRDFTANKKDNTLKNYLSKNKSSRSSEKPVRANYCNNCQLTRFEKNKSKTTVVKLSVSHNISS